MITQVTAAFANEVPLTTPHPKKKGTKRFRGTLTTPFAWLPKVLLSEILEKNEDTTLGRCQMVCRIWKGCITTELRLARRIILRDCLYRLEKMTIKPEVLIREYYHARFISFLSRHNPDRARQVAKLGTGPLMIYELFKLELAQNNLQKAQRLIDKLAHYKSQARVLLVKAFIKNFDYTSAMQTAIKIKECCTRFTAYLEIAEADPYGDYHELVDKLERTNYKKQLSDSDFALFYARLAKLFPPHDFTRAKEYAHSLYNKGDTDTFDKVVAIQAEVSLEAAIESVGELPACQAQKALKALFQVVAGKDPAAARRLIDQVDTPFAWSIIKHMLETQNPVIDLEMVENFCFDTHTDHIYPWEQFKVIMQLLDRGYKVSILLEKAKKLIESNFFFDFCHILVAFEAKMNVSEAIQTIERLTTRMRPYDLSMCWIAVAKAQNSHIPTAQKYTLVETISDQQSFDLITELAEVTSAFDNLSLK